MFNEDLVLAYQQGDHVALESLIDQNRKIVTKIAYKFYIKQSNALEYEDLIQEGYMGLMNAAKRYDFNNPKKVQFITYAIYWIYKYINRFVLKNNTGNECSLYAKVNEEGDEIGNEIRDEKDYAEYVEKSLYYEQMRDELEHVMREELTMLETSIIKLYFGWDSECISLGEMVDLYKMEKDTISKYKRGALNRMRRTPWAREEWRKRRYEREIATF